MKGSILIFGKNKQVRKQYINKLLKERGVTINNNPDLLLIEKEEKKRNIGIKEIRESIKWLQEKPYNSKEKILVIEEGKYLSIPAQNALLKTLEEPPKYAIIYITINSTNDILETILSRCQRINLNRVGDLENPLDDSGEIEQENYLRFEDFLKKTDPERLVWIEEAGKLDRVETIAILEKWIIQARSLLVKTGNKRLALAIETISKVQRDLEDTNINQKLAMETLELYFVQ